MQAPEPDSSQWFQTLSDEIMDLEKELALLGVDTSTDGIESQPVLEPTTEAACSPALNDVHVGQEQQQQIVPSTDTATGPSACGAAGAASTESLPLQAEGELRYPFVDHLITRFYSPSSEEAAREDTGDIVQNVRENLLEYKAEQYLVDRLMQCIDSHPVERSRTASVCRDFVTSCFTKEGGMRMADVFAAQYILNQAILMKYHDCKSGSPAAAGEAENEEEDNEEYTVDIS